MQAGLMCQKKMLGVLSRMCITLLGTDRVQLDLNIGN